MITSKQVLCGFGLLLCLAITGGCCEVFRWPWCPQSPPDDTTDQLAEPEIFTFNPGAITRLCPTHTGGDREFRGHGPDVTASATLELRNSNKEVWVNLYLHVKETRSDWTEAEGRWQRHLWTAPEGYTIINIVSHQSSNASYRDTDHDLDRPAVQGGSLVRKFEIMGDTGGNDVGHCTDDDVYMNVYFNTVKVKGREIE